MNQTKQPKNQVYLSVDDELGNHLKHSSWANEPAQLFQMLG